MIRLILFFLALVCPTLVRAQVRGHARPPAHEEEVQQSSPVAPPLVRELPSPIKDVVAGNGGRYLILHMPGELVMYDVELAMIVHKLAVPADAMVAAGLEKLIVASPSQQTIQCYDMGRLAERPIESVPFLGVLKAIALGYASRGPLLVFWAIGTDELANAYYTLLNVETLRPIRIDAVLQQRHGNQKRMVRPVAVGRLD